MPIPSEFSSGNPRQDFMVWFNSVTGKLSDQNDETFRLLKYWASLTTAQKNTIKAQFVADITSRKADLDAIASYVNTEV